MPERFSKLPPIAKFPLGRVTVLPVINTEPVLVAFVSLMVNEPFRVNWSEATSELLKRTVFPPAVLVKTNGLPLFVNVPEVTLNDAPIVVVPVGKVTAPFDWV